MSRVVIETRYRATEQYGHPLDDIEAGHITARLHRDGIDLAVRIVDRIAHLYPTHDVTTSEEVYALAAFLEATDTPLRWHKRVSA